MSRAPEAARSPGDLRVLLPPRSRLQNLPAQRQPLGRKQLRPPGLGARRHLGLSDAARQDAGERAQGARGVRAVEGAAGEGGAARVHLPPQHREELAKLQALVILVLGAGRRFCPPELWLLLWRTGRRGAAAPAHARIRGAELCASDQRGVPEHGQRAGLPAGRRLHAADAGPGAAASAPGLACEGTARGLQLQRRVGVQHLHHEPVALRYEPQRWRHAQVLAAAERLRGGAQRAAELDRVRDRPAPAPRDLRAVEPPRRAPAGEARAGVQPRWQEALGVCAAGGVHLQAGHHHARRAARRPQRLRDQPGRPEAPRGEGGAHARRDAEEGRQLLCAKDQGVRGHWEPLEAH
mmetsp:Transcript_102017/g.297551  ORF Transcript_102017/g.297551 Transcript_102017/m.297551 type:complete len:351 (+) Transcript_102017:401-1453(+)